MLTENHRNKQAKKNLFDGYVVSDWAASWRSDPAPVVAKNVIVLDDPMRQHILSFDIDDEEFSVEIGINAKEQQSSKTHDPWLDQGPNKIIKSLEDENFLSLHVYKKQSPMDDFELQSLVRIVSDSTECYFVPGTFNNQKSKYFYPMKKLPSNEIEIEIEVKRKTFLSRLSNYFFWAEMLSSKLQSNENDRYSLAKLQRHIQPDKTSL